MNDQQYLAAGSATPLDEICDVIELRRIARYFRDMAKTNGARLLAAEGNATRYRQEVEQKTRGFSLLSRLSSDVWASEEPPYVARIMAGHLNGMLNMNRTLVLAREASSLQFQVLASSGYSDADQMRLKALVFAAPLDFIQARRVVSTSGAILHQEGEAFAPLDIRYFMAIPVIADDEVKAIMVTGRMREQPPFSPPLSASDIETVVAICGFFGAYLARHRLIERDRERSRDRIAEVERLVTQRTAEIERQRALVSESLEKLHETQQQLIIREKLAFLGQLMAGIAHEIRNPLNFINNFSDLSSELVLELEELIHERLTELASETRGEVDELFGTLRENIGRIALHGKRADSIVRNMLQHSSGDNGGAEVGDLNAILSESIDFAYHVALAQNSRFDVTITRDLDASIQTIMLVPQQISRVFVNLLSNAFSALA